MLVFYIILIYVFIYLKFGNLLNFIVRKMYLYVFCVIFVKKILVIGVIDVMLYVIVFDGELFVMLMMWRRSLFVWFLDIFILQGRFIILGGCNINIMIFFIWYGNMYIKYFLVKKYIILICNLMFIEYFWYILLS